MLTAWRDFNDALRTIDFLHRHIDQVFDDRSGVPYRGKREKKTRWKEYRQIVKRKM